MLYKIWGFHGSDYEECRLLGYKNPIHTSQGTHCLSLRFDIFTAVTKKIAVFWEVTPCGCCKSRRFGKTYRFHHPGDNNWRARNVSSN
jgi:hypothetical protein